MTNPNHSNPENFKRICFNLPRSLATELESLARQSPELACKPVYRSASAALLLRWVSQALGRDIPIDDPPHVDSSDHSVNALYLARQARGMTLVQAEDQSGITRATVRRLEIERGVKPQSETVRRLTEVYGVYVEDLVDGEGRIRWIEADMERWRC